MRDQFKIYIPSLMITLAVLTVLEIFGSTLLPLFGIENYRLSFVVLVVLYLGLRLETAYMALFILILQYFHSLFTIEGWEMGTIAGIVICIIISYLKDLIHLSSFLATIFVIQLFQVLWFVIVSSLLYLKLDDFSYIVIKFWRFLPESILISLTAPLFFKFFDKVWRVKEKGILGEEA